MNYFLQHSIFFLFLFIGFIGFSQTIEVCENCKIISLKEAILVAKDFDTIVVKKGIYKEHDIIINKPLTIIGKNYPVIDGQMTLGSMLAVQYIIGQLNGPLSQMVNFIGKAQDAKISLERLSDIYNQADEEPAELNRITQFPTDRSLYFYGL